MWQKIRSIWRYIAKYYADDYDYFYLAGDDAYVVMENLYDYLRFAVYCYLKGFTLLCYSSPYFNDLREKNEGIVYSGMLVCGLSYYLAIIAGHVYTIEHAPRGRFGVLFQPYGDFLFGGPGYILNSKAVKVQCFAT